MGRKIRLDKLLVDRALAPSRHRARELIEAGQVLVDGVPTTRPAAQVDSDRPVALRSEDPGWVGRGALKLAPVLAAFGVDPSGRVCADLGASTGGFSEVLLRAGAGTVHAVDVGHNLLHERVRDDPRVVVHEGVNARYLEAGQLGCEPVTLLVADLAFISITKVFPAMLRVLAPAVGAGERVDAVVLVKPQFEVGAERLGSGGVVRREEDRREAIDRVRADAGAVGFVVLGGVDAPVAGARSGNLEHFLHLRPRAPSPEPPGSPPAPAVVE